MRWLLWGVLVAGTSTGCVPDKSDTADTSEESGLLALTDNDGDGYYAEEDDCDDNLAYVNPGATEACDGIDNDCDSLIDDSSASDALAFYTDYDLDGYGAEDADAVLACSKPTGYVSNNTDCDDDASAVNPGEDEVCDGLDNNCDGETDDESAVDAGVWYPDADEDGYGVTEDGVTSCEQPEGYAEHAEDCDDTDAAYNPGAAEDDCTDPNDYNCDGATGFSDADGDGFAACEDCDDDNADINPGADEVCGNALDDDCDTLIDDEDDPVVGATAWYPDEDEDGFGEDDPEYNTFACEQPAYYVDNTDDCDPVRADVNPLADELCDGVDNNCDGVIDEGC